MKRTPQPSFAAQVAALRPLYERALAKQLAAATAQVKPGDTTPVPSTDRKAA